MMSFQSSEQHWVVEEFSGVELGDERRATRLLQLAATLAENPGGSLPQAMGNRASLKAAYRFFDNDEIFAEDLLSGHVSSTIERARLVNASVLLAIQDTSELDYSTHKATKGIGKLGYNKGCLLHNTLLSTCEGVPLGLLQQRVWARPLDAKKMTRQESAKTPIEEKESSKWLESVEQLNELAPLLPNTTLLSVSDREADLFELFAQEREPNVGLLVRSEQNRCVNHPEKYLRETLQSQPSAGKLSFLLPRRGEQKAREVKASVRFCEVELQVPKRLIAHGYKENQRVWGILLEEENVPEGAMAVDWLLLTTVAVESFDKALEVIGWYRCRWLIELFHKVLKSGCKIEKLQLGDLENIKRALPLYSVIAWRILYTTTFARELPDIPATALLSEDEWQALYCAIHRVPEPSAETPTLA